MMYCLSSYTPAGLCLSTVNPLSGVINQISTTGLPNGTSGYALSTVDPINGKYYFVYPNNINEVDLNTGTLISSTTLNGSVGYMQFNMPDTSIYCLSNQTPSVSAVFLARLNPSTGVLSYISPNSLASSINGSSGSALDPINRKYYFVSNGNIISVDLQSGLTINTAPLSRAIDQIVFNCTDTTIYGLTNPTTSTVSLVSLAKVSPLTGSVTIISSSSIATSMNYSSFSAIDYINQNYCFVSLNNFISLDLHSGGVVSNNSLSKIPLLIASSPLCNIITDVEDIRKSNYDVSIFPNPIFDESEIVVKKSDGRSIRVVLNNSLGMVEEFDLKSSDGHLYIRKGKLSSGVYSLSVFLGEDLISKLKIIIL